MVKRVWLLGLCLCGLAGATGCTSDKKPTTLADGGASDAAVDAGRPCKLDSDCDDDLFCTGTESCHAGKCLAGTPLRCDDGIACTLDRCSERKRGCESLPPDSDGDGHYANTCKDKSGKVLGDDCDDNDPLRFPGNIETCDAANKDDDCDPKTFGNKDSDDDGFYDQKCCNAASDQKGAKLNCGTDCDDLKPSVNPKATEACDLFDNNCNGQTDEGVSIKQYVDSDHDGHGKKGSAAVQACAGANGYAPLANDCNDKDPEVFEGQFEICDHKDNNCNGKIDEVQEDAPWFADADHDGFGDAESTPVYSCLRIPGRVLSNNDCNDEKAAINPAAAELCDGIDNDCSGKKDFKLGTNDFEDDDNDSVADAHCTGGQDCDDTDPTTGKGLDEVCDMRDNDCDGMVDEETAQTVWYLDKDGDGWGIDQGTALARCQPIPGRSANLGDCDDTKNSVHPTALETCNGVDDNCNQKQDEGTDYQCQLSNAVGFCKKGGCAVLSCFPGWGDCDKNPKNGCECKVTIVPISSGCAAGGGDSYCDDHNYCNGKEHCIGDDCYAGTPVNCSASETVLQGSFAIQSSLDIQMLAGIETITGDLLINAPGLQDLTGLESLKTIGGNLTVDGDLQNDTMIEANSLIALVGSGLINLTTVGGTILIEDNPSLTTILLPSLVTANELIIRRNDALVTLDGFDNLVALRGQLQIADNAALKTISGMKVLTDTGMFSIDSAKRQQSGSALSSITGLTSLSHVSGDLNLSGSALTKLSLPSLSQVDGNMGFGNSDHSNSTITSIMLPALVQVGQDLTIDSMHALVTLSLPKLKAVYGALTVSYDDVLLNPDLHSLTSVGPKATVPNGGGWGLYIETNNMLTNLDRFGGSVINCPSQQCSVYVSYNTVLLDCAAAEFASRLNKTDIPQPSIGPNGGPTPASDGGLSCPPLGM